MNASVVQVMRQVGQALKSQRHIQIESRGHDKLKHQSSQCIDGVATVAVTGQFDYIVTMEDLSQGQRIGNYSIDFRRHGSTKWEILVPPVVPQHPHNLGDRPDGHDPRDQYIGHKRIDLPLVKNSGEGAVPIAQVRLNCIQLIQRANAAHDPHYNETEVHVRQMSLHLKKIPW